MQHVVCGIDVMVWDRGDETSLMVMTDVLSLHGVVIVVVLVLLAAPSASLVIRGLEPHAAVTASLPTCNSTGLWPAPLTETMRHVAHADYADERPPCSLCVHSSCAVARERAYRTV